MKTNPHQAGATAHPVVGDRYWLPIASCPTGRKVNLLTKHGVSPAPGEITERTRHQFIGWEPMARVPKEWK